VRVGPSQSNYSEDPCHFHSHNPHQVVFLKEQGHCPLASESFQLLIKIQIPGLQCGSVAALA
jgi:hypothetical protein